MAFECDPSKPKVEGIRFEVLTHGTENIIISREGAETLKEKRICSQTYHSFRVFAASRGNPNRH